MAYVSVEELKKAIKSLEAAIALEKNDIIRDAAILRFRRCTDLGWKCARKQMGTSATAPKVVVREMAQNELIKDPKVWLEAIDHRNMSSHTYDESLADKVYDFAKNFVENFNYFLGRIS